MDILTEDTKKNFVKKVGDFWKNHKKQRFLSTKFLDILKLILWIVETRTKNIYIVILRSDLGILGKVKILDNKTNINIFNGVLTKY